MPNWVRTKVIIKDITDEEFKGLVEKYCTNDTLDFTKILPPPDDIYMGPLGPEELRKYGAKNWYDWQCDNWGTKWNACDGYIGEDEHAFEFQTAWSVALPVLLQFAQDIKRAMDIKYADEDYGSNLGIILIDIEDGEVIYDQTEYDNESPETPALLEELWDVSQEDLDYWQANGYF